MSGDGRIIVEVRDTDGTVLFIGSPAHGDTLRIERVYRQPARLVCAVTDLNAFVTAGPVVGVHNKEGRS